MVSPQLENGYLRVANELVEALCRTRLRAYEWNILMFIIRQTYGFNKKADVISLSQFSKATSISPPNCRRTIKSLMGRNMIVAERRGMRVAYLVQKNYEAWTDGTLSNERESNETVSNGTLSDKTDSQTHADPLSLDSKPLSNERDTKDIKTIQKTKSVSSSTSSKRKPTRLDPAALEAFRQFYQAFPRHVARQEAQRAWLKLNPDAELIKAIMTGVRRYAEEVKGAEPKYIKHAGPWLNGRRWEDEEQGNGNGAAPTVKDLGDGWVEVDGKRMTTATYKLRYGQDARPNT